MAARTDILTGVTALAAEYNGIEKASHVKSKLTDMMMTASLGWGCSLAAARQCSIHPSGIAIPDILVSNAGLYHTRLKFVEHMYTMQEITGGIVTTVPGEKDYQHPEIGPLVDKYLKGKTGVAAEERYRLIQLVQDMTASRLTGYLMSSAICAGGTPETNRVEVFRNYDLREKKERAKVLAKIKPDPYWGRY